MKEYRPQTLARYLALARRLASRNSGNIPSVTCLRQMGYGNLYQYMRSHANKFDQFGQDIGSGKSYDKKVRQKQLSLARTLSSRNKKRLPSTSWLTAHGYSGLVSYMSKHPDFFGSIKQETNHKTSEQHIATAEQLMRKYRGRLPGSWTIISEGSWALYKYMRRRPNLFRHLPGAPPPEKKGKSKCFRKRKRKK